MVEHVAQMSAADEPTGRTGPATAARRPSINASGDPAA